MIEKESTLRLFVKACFYSMFLFWLLFFSGCQLEAETIPDEDLHVVLACGSATYGKNPCDWVSELNFIVSHVGEDRKVGKNLSDFLANWVKQQSWKLIDKSSVSVVERPGEIMFLSPAQNKLIIRVLAFNSDTEKKNGNVIINKNSASMPIVITILVESRGKNIVYSFACETDVRMYEKLDQGIKLLLSEILEFN